jgi:23S rRNA (uracil1939-C5)-methyltransferase
VSGQPGGSHQPDVVTNPVVRAGHLVAGGDAFAHDDDGRVMLLAGALPGELVEVKVTHRSGRLLQGIAVDIIEPSSERITAPCPHRAQGCGGCDLQFVRPEALPAMKVAMVADALRHLGGLPDAVVEVGEQLEPWGFRTTVRALVDPSGRAGLRRARSHEPVPIEHCLVAHPLVDEVLADGRFPGAIEVVVRAGAASGDRSVEVFPAPRRRLGRLLAAVQVPDGVKVAGPEGRMGGGSGPGTNAAIVRERVAGRWWQVSAGSFFQTRPDGAEALVREVARGVDAAVAAGVDRDGGLVDAYAGVGLFAGALRDRGWTGPMVTVDRSGPSAADARINLADDDIIVVESAVENWRPSGPDGWPQGTTEVVVADPSRQGLGRDGVAALAGTGAGGVVLVSCDAAALGRDASLLVGEGFALQRSVLVDLFPHTHHVEVVSTFLR